MSESTPLRFRCLETTGAGGMGVVFRAEDLLLRRPVAIKILPERLIGQGGDVMARLLREARVAAALNHPAICTIYEVGTIGSGPGIKCPDGTEPFPPGTPFIAMELIEGRTLRRILEGKRPPAAALLDIAIQVADGLEAAHAGGVVHRDLKPENIMVTPQGRVKILDFGLARCAAPTRSNELDAGTVETLTDLIPGGEGLAGTIHYMSPEQAAGREIGPRSDLFSIGTILYEMFAGRRPFEGETWASTLAGIMEVEPEPLRSANPDAGDDVEWIAHRCLRKDPAERFDDAGELAKALRAARGALERGEPATAGVRPRRRLAIPAALGAALIIAALIYGIDRRSGRDDSVPSGEDAVPAPGEVPVPATIAVLPFAFHGPEDLRYLADGMVKLLGTTLDGAGALRSIDARAILALADGEAIDVADPLQGRALARRLGAGRFILGDIFAAGGELRINAALYEVQGDTALVGKATAEGAAENVFDLIDAIARQILLTGVGGTAGLSTRVAAVTTDSLPALKAYIEGDRQFRAGHFVQALEAFERAAIEDETFALAYYRLSLAAEWATRMTQSREAAEQAVRHAARLSEHDQRLLMALLAWHRGDSEEAERLYRTLLGTYPDDVEALFELGEVLFHGGPVRGRPLSEARRPLERVLSYEPEHVPALVHLARVAAAEGRIDELDDLTGRLSRLNPDGDRSLEAEALRLFASSATDLPEDLLPLIERTGDVPLLLAASNVAIYTRNLAGAARLVRTLAAPQRSSEIRAQGLIVAALLEAARGRMEEADRYLSRSAALNPDEARLYRGWMALLPFHQPSRAELEAVRAEIDAFDPNAVRPIATPSIYLNIHNGIHPHLRLYLLGMIDAQLGEGERALQYAATLRSLDPPPGAGPIDRALALGIEARSPAGRLDTPARLALVERARMDQPYQYITSSPFYSQTLDRFLQAELYESLGKSEEALRWYGSFGSNSTQDLVLLAPAHLGSAGIHERAGNAQKAVEHYRAFAGLWRECDAALRPLVDEALSRIEMLSTTESVGRPRGS